MTNMKNTNMMLNKIKTTVKTSKIVKLLTLWFNKFAKLANLKPKQLIILLGLLLVSLATLGLGMMRGTIEGNTALWEDAEKRTAEIKRLNDEKVKYVDAMNCAINNSSTSTSVRTNMRTKINAWYNKFFVYKMQYKIFKLKSDDNISASTPKYVDDITISSLSTTNFQKYKLEYTIDKDESLNDSELYKIKNESYIIKDIYYIF